MFSSLYAKTFAIICSQLFITWAITVLVIKQFTKLYDAKTEGITASTNEDGLLDLEIDQNLITPPFVAILVIDIIVFLLLLHKGQQNLLIGLPLFSIWSILTGIGLALVFFSFDENLGSRVLAITVMTTIACVLVGIHSGIEFGFSGEFLFFALWFLVLGNVIRLLVTISGNKQRLLAFLAVLIFTGYLLYDFNRLAKIEEIADANTWPAAMDLSITIYLDIIKLILD